MKISVAFALLVFSAIALGDDVQHSNNEQADLADEVNLVQMAMKVDSGKGKVLSAGPVTRKKYEKVPIEEIQVDEVAEEHTNSTKWWWTPYLESYWSPDTTTTTIDPKYDVDAFANISAVQLNAAGDLAIFVAGLEFNIELVIFFMIVFIVLLRYFPNMYAFRATGAYLEGAEKQKAQTAPFTWDADEKFYLTWIWYAYAPDRDQLVESSGLDAAMLLGFTDMALEILTGIGVPFVIIFWPIYAFMGGNAAGDDYLSHLGVGNVELGSWIFWPVSLSTWYVVMFTQRRLFVWMRYFIEYRDKFLLSMPKPQCTTVLVEGIPDEHCSDAALKAYFTKMYGASKVLDAYCVKKTASLEKKIQEFEFTDRKLKETRFWIKHNPGQPRPKFRLMHHGQDCEEYYESELARLGAEIKAEQDQVNLEAKKSPEESDIYATNGFVTFDHRSTVQQVMGTMLRIAEDEFVVSYPPEPADIIWGDLEETVAGRFFAHVLGYGCVAGLFFGFMPIVLAISQAANIETLEDKYPAFKSFTDALGDYRDTLGGVLASIGLTLMMSFLPTFLVLIFNNFFTLIASRWAQLYIQSYYFWFLILFVLLVTSIGPNLTEFLSDVAQSPFSIFSTLAGTMPYTTHFYMNYISTQYVSHAMNLTRYINLTKYCLFKRLMDPEDARALAEPEDQDYYGMGSRSSRFAFMLVLALVFCSICPLMVVLTWGNFFLCKFIYGYLIPYAESKKKDLGGNHFALQCIHIHMGLLIYLVMMTGLLFERAATTGPGFLSALSFLWWVVSFNKFRTQLHWEHLCYEDVKMTFEKVPMREGTASYKQECLDADILQKITSKE